MNSRIPLKPNCQPGSPIVDRRIGLGSGATLPSASRKCRNQFAKPIIVSAPVGLLIETTKPSNDSRRAALLNDRKKGKIESTFLLSDRFSSHAGPPHKRASLA